MTENMIWLIIAIYCEAANQSLETNVKIGHAVLNRTIKRRMSIKEVVSEPHQFPWYQEILNGNKVLGGNSQEVDALVKAAEAASICYEERNAGYYFHLVDHFYSDDIDEPYWASSMKYAGKFDNFYFFRS